MAISEQLIIKATLDTSSLNNDIEKIRSQFNSAIAGFKTPEINFNSNLEQITKQLESIRAISDTIKLPLLNIGADDSAKIAEANLKKLQAETDILEQKKSALAEKELAREAAIAAKREADSAKLLATLEKQEALSQRKLLQGNGDGNSQEQKDLIRQAKIYEELIRFKQQLSLIKNAGFSDEDRAKAEKFAKSVNDLNLAKIDKEFNQIGTGTRNFTGNLRDAAEQLSVFAGKINELRTTSVDFAKEFNQASRQLSTRSDDSSGLIAGFKGLDTELKRQVSTLDLVKNAYDNLPSTFIKTADATRVSAASFKLAGGTSSDFGGTTKGLSQLLIAYGADAGQAATFADKLAFANKQTGEKTNVLASELARLVPASKAAGLGFDELNALLIQATNQGIPARQALSAIEGSLKQITTDTARQEFARLGIAFDENILKQKGYVGLLKEVNSSQNLAADSITKIFGEQAKLNKIIPAGADGFQKLDEAVKGSINSNGLANEQFNKTSTAAKAVQVSVEEAFTALGQAVLKVSNPILQGTKALADAFLQLPSPIQNTIGALVGGVGVFLSLSAALTGILAVTTPTLGAFKILATTFAQLGATSLSALNPINGLQTSLINADGNATRLAGNLKTLGGAIATAALAAGAFIAVKDTFETITNATRGTTEATKELTASYEDYLRKLKEPLPDRVKPQQGDEFKDLFQNRLNFFESIGDAANDATNKLLNQKEGDFFFGRTNKDVKSEQSSINFAEQITQSDKAIAKIQELQQKIGAGVATPAQIKATNEALNEQISIINRTEAVGDLQKSAKTAQLNFLEILLEQQKKLTTAKIEEAAVTERATAATKKQVEQAKLLQENANADRERTLTRQQQDQKTVREQKTETKIETVKRTEDAQLEAIKADGDRRKRELDAKQQIETQNLQAKFNQTENEKETSNKQKIEDLKKSAQEGRLAEERKFTEEQNRAKAEFSKKERELEDAAATARKKRDEANTEAFKSAKDAASNASELAKAKPEDRDRILRQQQEEERIRQAARQLPLQQNQTKEGILSTAKGIAGTDKDPIEEARKVALAISAIEEEQKRKQAEIDRAEDIKREAEKRKREEEFTAQQQLKKQEFDDGQKKAEVEFLQKTIQPIETEFANQKKQRELEFQQGVLAELKRKQQLEDDALKAVQAQQERETRLAFETEIKKIKDDAKQQELTIDRANEDAKIARERAFKAEQRALDEASAVKILQILGQAKNNIVPTNKPPEPTGTDGGIVDSLANSILNKVPKFETGVSGFAGGLAVVGEDGAELVSLPRGANVIPNNRLASLSPIDNRTVTPSAGNNKRMELLLEKLIGSVDRPNLTIETTKDPVSAAADFYQNMVASKARQMGL